MIAMSSLALDRNTMNKRGAIKKACDQCNRRRIKCDGQSPCQTCAGVPVNCTYEKPVQRKGPPPDPEGRTAKKRRKQEQQEQQSVAGPSHLPGRLPSPTNLQDQTCGNSRSPFIPPPDPEGRAARKRRKQQQEQQSSSSAMATLQPLTLNAVAGGSRLSCTVYDPALEASTETFAEYQSPPVPGGYQSLGQSQQVNLPSATFPDPLTVAGSVSPGQTREAYRHDASHSYSNNNTDHAQLQLVTAPVLNHLSVLATMSSDDSGLEGLFTQLISSRPASPFRLLDVGPFGDTNLAFAQGGIQQFGWGAPASGIPSGSVEGGLFAGIGMLPTNSVELTIPITPTAQMVSKQRDISPMFTVCLHSLIRPQIDIFFSRIAPMIPVFTASYIRARLDDASWHDRDFVGMALAMTALSLVHPLNVEEARQRQNRVRQAQILMDEALKLRDGWQFGSTATVESIMTSYLMFGTLYEMGYAAGAKLRLREAVSLGETMGLHDPKSYLGLGRAEVLRRLKTYWVLSVTERAYSLQHSGGIVFEGSISTGQILPPKDLADVNDDEGTSPSLRYLAHLFSFIDQDIVTCWNGRCDGPACRCLTEARATNILSKLGGGPADVFGHDFETQLRTLAESQRADLLITWQWLRNRIWRLAFLHGLAREGGPVELSRVYLANVAIATLDICKDLSNWSMDAHGAGFMQKLYDIASAIPELLRHDVLSAPRMFTPAQTGHLGQVVRQLYGHVARYRAGNSEFVQPLAEAITLASLTVVQDQ